MELRYNGGMSSMGSEKKSPAQLPDLKIIQADPFAEIPWLRHGFSTRYGGVSEVYGERALNLGITAEDTREAVGQNRKLFFARIGAVDEHGIPWPSVNMRQVHSSVIHRVDQLPAPLIHGDGVVSNRAGFVLSVRVADCLPVLLADPVHRAVGAFHAGWRGTLARIVEKGVGELRRNFGSDPAEMKAAIGPGIHRCCYEVSEDLRDQFASQFVYASQLFEERFDSDPVRKKYPLLFMNMRPPGHGDPPRSLHLDLVEANRRQLHAAGVREENIWISDLCTSCRTDILFSHRKEKGVTGRMIGAIAIKS
jgi:polyphenol oxidase